MFAIQSRRVVFDDRIEPAVIRVDDERIIEIASYPQPGVLDVGDAAIMPGLVDPHVHLNQPGRTDWEGMQSGTAAAAAGGITALCDMPLNSSPVTTNPSALLAKHQASVGILHMDVGFHGGLVPGNVDQMEALIDAGVLGIKVFLCHSGIDDFPNTTQRELRLAMPILARRGIPLLAHAEISHPVEAMRNPRRYADYLASRPPSFEREAIAMMIELAAEYRCHVHIVHLADAGSIPMLTKARQNGIPITVETCPHYLVFESEQIPDGATAFKCAPPIRDAKNREGLWQALADGVIDLIASDHSPCPPEMKSLDEGRFDRAWGGISSLQVGVSAIWTEASARGFSLVDLARWMSHAPARLLGLDRGIAVGKSADLFVFNDNESWTIRGDKLLHRHKTTPYDGRNVRGRVVQTYVRGQPTGLAQGQIISRRALGPNP